MVIGGILAGGLGTRMATDGLPKQFLKVGGVPVIIRTLRRFMENSMIDYNIIAMNEDWIDFCSDMLDEYNIDRSKVEIITGGNTRFESLLCLARRCVTVATKAGDADKILMINHDCARPFVSDRILCDNINMVKDYDMVTTSIPTIDTILVSKDGKLSDGVPDRHTIFCDQGPQTIEVNHFLALADTLTEKEREIYIEAGRLYIEKGYRVGIVLGERENFKLTTKFDLTLAELMLAEGTLK